MATPVSKKKNAKNNDKGIDKPKAILLKYRDRLQSLRQAKEYTEKDEITRAVVFYVRYLDALAAYLGVDEKQLNPSLFDKQQGLAEILMVSQVYWDLARAYDRHPKMYKESERCLEQFVKFSIGFKFQYINSEIVRKFLRKNMAYNPKAFEMAHERIRVSSKGCYVATFCYGEDHQTTNELRDFKGHILNYKAGKIFVDLYYRYSPVLVEFLERNFILGSIFKLLTKPLLKSFAFFSTKFIISK